MAKRKTSGKKKCSAGGPPATAAARRKLVTVGLAADPNPWLLAQARSRGWRWQLLRTNWSADGIPRGALVECLPDDDVLHDLIKAGCPVVRIGKLPHADESIVPVVRPDWAAHGRLAADHFAERRFRDVAYFGHSPWGDARPLFEGFRDRAQELEMTCHLYQVKGLPKESARAKALRQNREFSAWIRDLPKPVGLLAPGAFIAGTFCALTKEAGLGVPEDVAILANRDEKGVCDCMMPSISSIDGNVEGRLGTACDLLAKLMAGRTVPAKQTMIPPAGIVERESTNVLATSDKNVAAALRYMWDNLDMDLSVDDIARASFLSARQLERRFMSSLNRSINEELRRKRLEEAKQLLSSTGLTIAEIAPLVGFRSTTYLHRTFRAAFGMTPAQYRRKHR